jgi:tRNA pseudouridine55 synthase
VIALGEATKFSGGLLEADKAYRARLALGVRTATGDAEGAVLSRSHARVSEGELRAVLDRFRGEIAQVPPMYAAIKHEGRPLYAYARAGECVARAPRRVTIRRLELEGLEGEEATLLVECSKGTYIRALADDIGEELGCGAHLAALVRLAVGPFTLERATGLDALEALSLPQRRERLLPPQALLESWPRLLLARQLALGFRRGRKAPAERSDGAVAVFDEDGAFLGTGEVSGGVLKPKRLMASS